MIDRKLWHESMTYEEILAEENKEEVILNLHEDILCLKEELADLKEENSGNLKIKKWIRTGYMNEEPVDTDALLETAGRLLDKAYSHEITGEVLFEAEDGRMMVGTVQFLIQEANPEYVKMVMEEEAEDEE